MTCPIMDTLNLLGKKWTLCILHTISQEEAVTFTYLSKELKLNPRTLSNRLTILEKEKIITKQPKAYVLTKKGKELIESFAKIDTWAKKYQ